MFKLVINNNQNLAQHLQFNRRKHKNFVVIVKLLISWWKIVIFVFFEKSFLLERKFVKFVIEDVHLVKKK